MLTKAVELAETHGWFLTRQFENEANADAHTRTTAREILANSDRPKVVVEKSTLPVRTADLTAMKLLADGGFAAFNPDEYELIPNNTSGRIMHFIFRNATMIDRAKPDVPVVGDIGTNLERRRAEQLQPTVIRQIGDLSAVSGLEGYDASEFNVTGRFQPLKPGTFGELLF